MIGQIKYFVFCIIIMGFMLSCNKDSLSELNIIEPAPKLSDYGIFQGNPNELEPTDSFVLYEISTQLFSDYLEKQRLIKIPAGQSITAVGSGLPEFPEGTVLVKTFYYFHDKRDTSKGKRNIETRLLIKTNSHWNVATYLWNPEQTEAYLVSSGIDREINWINEKGSAMVFSYHLPDNGECATCHTRNNSLIPLGPKIRNLNRDVMRGGIVVNQLKHWEDQNLISPLNHSSYETLPDWQDPAISLEKRARAYLDVNCAHCHHKNGKAKDSRVVLDYETAFSSTKINNNKSDIIDLMSKGKMPQLGISTVDKEGLELIRAYIETL